MHDNLERTTMRQSSFSVSFLAHKIKTPNNWNILSTSFIYNYFSITSGLGHFRTIAELGKFIASQPHKRLSWRPTGGRTKQGFTTQGTTFIARHRANDFFLSPPRSSYKKLFIGTSLGEKLQVMSSVMTWAKKRCRFMVGWNQNQQHY